MSTDSRRFGSVGVLLVVMAAATLFAFFAAGCGDEGTTSTEATSTTSAGSPVAVDEWDLTMLSVLSGPVAFAGEPALWGAQYAAEQINASGGIRGVSVKITGIDTAFDPAKAASGMTTATEKGLIVLGPMDGPSAAAAAPVFVDAQVPVVAALTSPEERANALPYGAAYMIDDGPPSEWAVQEWLKLQPDIKKLVVFWDPSDPANKIEMEATVKAFEAAGATEAGAVEVKAGQLDMGTPAIKALSYNADGYVCLVRMEEFAKLAVELNDRGMKDGWRLYAPFAAFGSDLLNLGKGSLEGAYIWNKLDITSQDPAWLEFVDAYKADHSGQEPVVPPVLGYYDVVNALKQIFEKYEITGDPAKLAEERQKITEALADGATYDGLQFPWKWQDGQMEGSAFLYQVENGKFVMAAAM